MNRIRPAVCAVSAAGVVLTLSLAFAGAVEAQVPGVASLNDLVLDWVRGDYASPLICKIDGKPQRGLRRIVIEPGGKKSQPAQGRVRFVDLEAEPATRCFTEIGGTSPNITGELAVRHAITKQRDTAFRDFKVGLRRERGYELDIVSGQLLLTEVGAGSVTPESLDFRGGKMRIHLLRSGTDAVRLLKDLPSPRKVMLEFETRTGRTLSFAASLARPKGAVRPSGRR